VGRVTWGVGSGQGWMTMMERIIDGDNCGKVSAFALVPFADI